MKQLRRGVFETNSSSTHSITICSGDEFDLWREGEIYYNDGIYGSTSEFAHKQFVTIDELRDIAERDKYFEKNPYKMTESELVDEYYEISTYEGYEGDLEWFDAQYVTASGERVVAFGKYGYGG